MNWVFVTQKERKSSHEKNVFSIKNGLKRKVLMDIYPRKEDRAIRDHFEKCLLCTLYQVEFILSSAKVVISHALLIWPTLD